MINVIVKWRQLAEVNDPVWWIDMLPWELFSEGFGLQTPMLTGQLKVPRYYPLFQRCASPARCLRCGRDRLALRWRGACSRWGEALKASGGQGSGCCHRKAVGEEWAAVAQHARAQRTADRCGPVAQAAAVACGSSLPTSRPWGGVHVRHGGLVTCRAEPQSPVQTPQWGTAVLPVDGGGGGSGPQFFAIFRNLSQLSTIFPQLLFACPPCMLDYTANFWW